MHRQVWSEQARWGDVRRPEGAGWTGRLQVCVQGATRGAWARCSERGEWVIGRGRRTITSATIYDYQSRARGEREDAGLTAIAEKARG